MCRVWAFLLVEWVLNLLLHDFQTCHCEAQALLALCLPRVCPFDDGVSSLVLERLGPSCPLLVCPRLRRRPVYRDPEPLCVSVSRRVFVPLVQCPRVLLV